MPQENLQNQLTTEARTVLGRLEPTVWAAIKAGLEHLAHKADVNALSDLLNKRSEEAVIEARRAETLRATAKWLQELGR